MMITYRSPAKAALLVTSLVASGFSFAQTCDAPLPHEPASGAVANGDTCTGANVLGDLCDTFTSQQNDIVYTFTITAPYTATSITLETSTPAFDPVLALQGPGVGTCAGAAPCLRTASSQPAGANEVLDVAGLSDGQYYLIVSANPASAANNCGAFTITANGTYPVELLNFTVD